MVDQTFAYKSTISSDSIQILIIAHEKSLSAQSLNNPIGNQQMAQKSNIIQNVIFTVEDRQLAHNTSGKYTAI